MARLPGRAAVAALVAAILLLGAPTAAHAAGGSITGHVTNGAGLPLGNYRVRVYGAGTGALVTSVMTDATGAYAVPLASGDYKLSFSSGYYPYPVTWYATAPTIGAASVVSVTEGGTLTADQQVQAGATLSGHATWGTTPVAGLNVWLVDAATGHVAASTTTDSAGAWTVSNLVATTYRLELWSSTNAYPATWWPQATSFAAAGDLTPAAGSTTTALDVNLATTATIAGTVTDGTTAAAVGNMGVLLYQGGAIVRGTSTAADGTYRFTGVAPGTYYVSFIDWTTHYPSGGYWPSGDSPTLAQPVTVAAGDTFTADKQVYVPADEPMPPYRGTAGGQRTVVIGDSITVQSVDRIYERFTPDGLVSAKGIGSQRFEDMVPMAQKMAATAPDQVVIALGANDAARKEPIATTQTAVEQMLSLFASARCVTLLTPSSSTGLADFNTAANAVGDLLRTEATTHPNVQIAEWQYLFAQHEADGDPGGSWTIDGLHLTPAGTVRYATLMRSGFDACQAAPSSLAGAVHEDVDLDGVVGPADPPLADVPITLSGRDDLARPVSRSTTTAADGTYAFGGLVGGSYQVTETLPLGHTLPYVTLGSAGGSADPAGYHLALPRATDAVGYGLANQPGVSAIAGRVFTDADASGTDTPGDPGRPHVTVTLSGQDALGNPVPPATVTTGADGAFRFDFLRPGTYTLTERGPYGTTYGGAITGLDGGVVGDHTITGIVTGKEVPLADGYGFLETADHVADWGTMQAGNAGISLSRGVVALPDGSAVVAGVFFGGVTLGAGQPNATTLASRGGADSYLARYDAGGQLLWAQQVGGTGNDQVLRIARDPATGDVVVSGATDGAFRIGVGAAAGDPVAVGGGGLVARFGDDGSFRWARSLPATDGATLASVAVGPDGDLVATGWFKGTLTAPDGSLVTANGTSVAGVVVRFGPDGSFRWVRPIQSPVAVLAIDVAFDPAGNAVVAGGGFAADFGGGRTMPGNTADAILGWYAPDGTVVRARSYGGPGTDAALGIAIDPTDGGIYLSGALASATMGTTDPVTANGFNDAMVAGLTPTGDVRWTRAYGGVYNDLATRLSVANGHLYVAGQVGGSFAVGGVAMPVAGSNIATVTRWGLDGSFDWVRTIGGAGDATAWDTAVLPDGGVLVAGNVTGAGAVLPLAQALPLPAFTYGGGYLTRLVG